MVFGHHNPQLISSDSAFALVMLRSAQPILGLLWAICRDLKHIVGPAGATSDLNCSMCQAGAFATGTGDYIYIYIYIYIQIAHLLIRII